MCNEVACRISLDLLRNDFDQRNIRLFYPENAPSMEPLPSIRTTDSTLIVHARDDWGRWLDPVTQSETLTRPLPAGTLTAAQVRQPMCRTD
jgi:hypothetical protein